jgi:hypothetical protein
VNTIDDFKTINKDALVQTAAKQVSLVKKKACFSIRAADYLDMGRYQRWHHLPDTLSLVIVHDSFVCRP